MSRLQKLTERDRLAPVIAQLEQGEDVDIPRVLTLQTLDIAQTGRAAMLDALDQQEKADAQLVAKIRTLLDQQR